jgi:sulfur-oxidizing protein SoxZ
VAVADKERAMTKVKPRVKVQKTAQAGEIIEIKTLISHPMHSGRAVDGDGNLIPRKIIKSFRVSFNGAEVISVNLKPSVSANPFFTFPFKVTEAGTFDFLWVEDDGTEYKKSAKISIG